MLDVVDFLVDTEGAEVSWLELDDFGRVHADTLAAAIAENPDDVALVTVMWANNEVGTVNPIRELAAVARGHDIPFHTDAVQALGQLPLDFGLSGADALTVTGHKVGGPTGIGVLLLRREVAVVPLLQGGGQERGVRSGTLGRRRHRRARGRRRRCGDASGRAGRGAGRLRDDLIAAVTALVPDVVLSGDPGQSLVDGAPSRLPGNAHLRFPGCEGDSLLMLLDANGIECSTGSACTAGVARPSHVLLAMGLDEQDARGALRFSFGHTSTPGDVLAVAEAIGRWCERARRAALAGARRR